MRAFLFVLAALALPAVSAAQGMGAIVGRVTDATDGSGLPGASVLVRGTTLGVATDLDGSYRVLVVPGGTYVVSASFTGYETATQRDVSVIAGTSTTLNFVLGEDEPEPCYHYSDERTLLTSDPFDSELFRTEEDECSGYISLRDLPVGW